MQGLCPSCGRRHFLKTGVLAGAALTVGSGIPASKSRDDQMTANGGTDRIRSRGWTKMAATISPPGRTWNLRTYSISKVEWRDAALSPGWAPTITEIGSRLGVRPRTTA